MSDLNRSCAAALAATDFMLTDGADCNKLKKRKKSAVGKAKARKSLCRRATKRASKPKKRLTKPKKGCSKPKNKINARTKAKKAAKKCAPAKKKN
ncbi:histone H1-gamma, late-like isoform X2 [Drosophila subobscura]|uniref:histone H1-gamma, late-like isoform X2 n=1 Tax=Drosophila subobscura TaxID=7241 RepID=UPI00155AE0C7|nr:histone H1-gamma, late-like isoform X2 [Drosophila subobscura]